MNSLVKLRMKEKWVIYIVNFDMYNNVGEIQVNCGPQFLNSGTKKDLQMVL
jgi:hypothetical protein